METATILDFGSSAFWSLKNSRVALKHLPIFKLEKKLLKCHEGINYATKGHSLAKWKCSELMH